MAQGYLDIAREKQVSSELEEVAEALDTIEELTNDVLALSREGNVVGEMEYIVLEQLVQDTWNKFVTNDAALTVEGELGEILVDKSRFRELLSNVFGNTIKHAGATVNVRVGQLTDEGGFYIEDDGPGVPKSIREDVFEYGYSTREDGTGYGLPIIKRIANGHGWSVRLEEGRDNGACFEFSGVEFAK